MGRTIDVYAEVLDRGRYYSKVEISMYNSQKELVAKSVLSAKSIEKINLKSTEYYNLKP